MLRTANQAAPLQPPQPAPPCHPSTNHASTTMGRPTPECRVHAVPASHTQIGRTTGEKVCCPPLHERAGTARAPVQPSAAERHTLSPTSGGEGPLAAQACAEQTSPGSAGNRGEDLLLASSPTRYRNHTPTLPPTAGEKVHCRLRGRGGAELETDNSAEQRPLTTARLRTARGEKVPCRHRRRQPGVAKLLVQIGIRREPVPECADTGRQGTQQWEPALVEGGGDDTGEMCGWCSPNHTVEGLDGRDGLPEPRTVCAAWQRAGCRRCSRWGRDGPVQGAAEQDRAEVLGGGCRAERGGKGMEGGGSGNGSATRSVRAGADSRSCAVLWQLERSGESRAGECSGNG